MAAGALAAGRAVAAHDAVLPHLLSELRGLRPLPPPVIVVSAVEDGAWLSTAQLATRLSAAARAGWVAGERESAVRTAQLSEQARLAYADAASRARAQAAEQRACLAEGEAARGLLAAAEPTSSPSADAARTGKWGGWAPPPLPLSPPVLALAPFDAPPADAALDAPAAAAGGASFAASADRALPALAHIHAEWRDGGDAVLATALTSAAGALGAAERALAAELGASGAALRAWLDTPPPGLCDAVAQLGGAGDGAASVDTGASHELAAAELSAVRACAAAHVHAAAARLQEACTARVAPALATACREVHTALAGVMAAQTARLLDARAALLTFYAAAVGASGEELLGGALAPRARPAATLEQPDGAALDASVAAVAAAAKPRGARGRTSVDGYRDDVSESSLAALLSSLPLRPTSLAAFDAGGVNTGAAANHVTLPSPTAQSVGSTASGHATSATTKPARPQREPVAEVAVDAPPSAAGDFAARLPAPRQRKLKAAATPAATPTVPTQPWPPLWDDGATAAAVAATAAGMPSLPDSTLCRSAESAVRLADAVEAQAVALLLRQTRSRAQRVCRDRAALEQAVAALRAEESRAAKARPPGSAPKGAPASAAPQSTTPARPPPAPTAELLTRAIDAGALEAAHGDAIDAPPCPPFDASLVVALRYEARCLRLAAARLVVHAAAFSCRAAALARQSAACSAAAVAAAQGELVACVDAATAAAPPTALATATARPCIRQRRKEEACSSGVAATGWSGSCASGWSGRGGRIE
jgi:hypothetical protein